MALPPLLRDRLGVPVTLTASLIATVKVTVAPTPTVPLPAVSAEPEAAIEATVGNVVSIRSVPVGLLPVAAAVLARLPAVSLSVAPFNESDVTARSATFCPACTVWLKTSVVLPEPLL